MNDRNPPSAGRALSRLVIVLAAALFVVLFAIGWNVTEISLDPVRDETRQAAVQRAMRQLLSPDIFTREREQRNYTTQFTIGCPEGEAPDNHFALDGDTYITIDPPCADSDDTIVVRGHHFPEDAIARIQTDQKLLRKIISCSGIEYHLGHTRC